jgi:putative MATE family efflux protein
VSRAQDRGQDLTQGSISGHIVRMAVPMALGMVFQTLYVLVDLYFVAQLGDAAIAGVSAAGNVQFIVMALTQVLGVGTTVLVAHAMGRREALEGARAFRQSLLLSGIAGVAVLALGFLAAPAYLRTVAADAETVRNGLIYLKWFLPALSLQFALISMGAALRGIGVARPTMLIQMTTVGLNAALAPVLIAGWGTGRPMGIAGAGLASTIAVAVGVVAATWYFLRQRYFAASLADAPFRPDFAIWKRLLGIGVPAGAEFGLMFISMAIVYAIVSPFGAAAQAGYGVGSRVMQSLFLPVMAVAVSAAPVAGQNVAAGRPDRARETFWAAARLCSALMALMTLFAHWRPEWLVSPFASDPVVVDVAAGFLRTISWNFVASGLVFTCSSMFQAMGNTIPTVISSAVRLVLFVVPALLVSRMAGFQLPWIWNVSVVATTLHAAFALWLLRVESARRLGSAAAAGV